MAHNSSLLGHVVGLVGRCKRVKVACRKEKEGDSRRGKLWCVDVCRMKCCKVSFVWLVCPHSPYI
jgi:hypothetical protein